MHMYTYEKQLFSHMAMYISSGRGSFLALSAAGHARGPRVNASASVGPGRALWRVLWAFKVARDDPKHVDLSYKYRSIY